MEKLTNLRTGLAIVAPLLVLATAILLASSTWVNHSGMAVGITLDFMLTAPLLYFLLSRKTTLPTALTFPLVITGAILASYLLPESQRATLDLMKTYGLPLVELGALTFIGTKVWKFRRVARQHKQLSDKFLLIQKASVEAFGSAGKLLAVELSMLYYAFLAWKVTAETNSFSVYKESGRLALYSVFILLIAVETLALHVILNLWSTLAAWILTIASLYTIIQLIGHINALRLRRLRFDAAGKNFYIPNGLFGGVNIPVTAIQKIEKISGSEKFENVEHQQVALLPQLEHPNVAIYLTSEVWVEKAYGFGKSTSVVLASVDDVAEFKMLVKNRISN